jgi:hypothetical protein
MSLTWADADEDVDGDTVADDAGAVDGKAGDGVGNDDVDGDAETGPAVAAAAKAGDERTDEDEDNEFADRDAGLANTWFDPFCETVDLAVFG